MNQLIILKGLPGSGKSTKAKELAGEFGLICSADNFFVGKDGVYSFKRENILDAHRQCKDDVVRAMINQTELIIVDNTNTMRWEYQFYLDKAVQYQYNTRIEMVGNLTDVYLYFSRNIHGVPLEVVKKMAARFQLLN